ncbi:type II toxin-antitoxin system PemK/MazF family toxin [Rouxiella sp. T17]|uniref:type II toxin-antitoxin system PemK/MazF family toxin n=1 Tax=Rouxiella sp. T17 TaxID=3085684 RepID=UPI002FC5ECD4
MTAIAQEFHPLPPLGTLVWCKFPQKMGTPGPKARPALVIRVATKQHAVAVIYGTSKKLNKIYPTEFAIRKGEPGFPLSNLDEDTKFDTETFVQLPYDDDWFQIAPPLGADIPMTPELGVLHPNYFPALRKAASNAKNFV